MSAQKVLAHFLFFGGYSPDEGKPFRIVNAQSRFRNGQGGRVNILPGYKIIQSDSQIPGKPQSKVNIRDRPIFPLTDIPGGCPDCL